MIEQYLRNALQVPHNYRLVEIEKAREHHAASCTARYFNLIDENRNLVAGFDAWMVEQSFFGFFRYSPQGQLLERKMVALYSPTARH